MFLKLIRFITILLILVSCQKEKAYQFIKGNALGTTFSVKYDDFQSANYSKSIDSLFVVINHSLSTYHTNSLISKINKGDTLVKVDTHFITVFKKAKRIYTETDGAFDPTIGSLVNAWGFGPKEPLQNLDSAAVKDLMQLVGFNKVSLASNFISKINSNIFIDFNAIAKGYTVDVIARFLESKKCKNYMVEIGGEVRVQGLNPDGNLWRIGIEKPLTDGTRDLETSITLQNQSMATSGNYRKFKIDSQGNKFVHTINPKTGFTIQNDILSASVISKNDCADVDAYATAFMVLGFEKTKEFLEVHPELQVFLIYVDIDGKTRFYETVDG
jgi:thiamine biosynthesis lipoprotein